MRETAATTLGPGIGAAIVGLILVIFGIASFINYKGFVDYMHVKDVSAWKKAPGLVRYFGPRMERTSVHQTGIYMGCSFTTIGALGIIIGIASIIQHL